MTQPYPSSAPSSGQILHLDRNQATYVFKRLVVVAWRGACDASAIRRVEVATMMALDNSTGKCVAMGIVEPTAVPLSDETRALTAASNDRLHKAGAMAFAGVVAQSGFFGSVVRGIVTGLTLLSRSPYPFRMFDDHPDAITWLAQRAEKEGVSVSTTDYINAVTEFRKYYELLWNRDFKP
jgi:hypothetical protein